MTDAGSQDFDALLQRHRGIVHKVAGSYASSREDRADLAQEIAARLWQAWPSYDPARPFATWMYRIALNTGISFLRGHARRQARVVPLDSCIDSLVDDTALDPETHERIQILERFMQAQGPLDRALLVLYLEAHSGRDIADILGIGESNVTTRINRLKQRLRAFVAR
ncbi:RNA polymerase sigma factor [Luteimonas abyssi]|uniref:RNA polymerase sigma factor n=1 Tax=Luteimonas abyssi TaxID=1247514 RepID=UPI000737D01A|nr:sigma-70 family RNA polymerase sigma factor [Luteimonas abyssi]